MKENPSIEYTLWRRYSDFLKLWEHIRSGKYPEFANFKFPSKALLSSNSDNTKIKRMECFDRMIKLNAKFLSLGMPINLNCSQVHHAELMMNVPYRYNKKFSHRIKRNNKIYKKDFDMFVLKEQHLKIKRNKNKKIIENFSKKEKIFRSKLGNNFIYSYDLKKFYEINMKLFKKDIFCWVGKKLI